MDGGQTSSASFKRLKDCYPRVWYFDHYRPDLCGSDIQNH